MSSNATFESRDVRHFEDWSRRYERSWMQRFLFSRIHRAVLDLAAPLPTPATVLDVGCGTGRLLRGAAARWPGARLIGVDPAEGMVHVARQLTPSATFHRALAQSLPLPDASVDLVFSTISFHHWRDHAGGVREIARVLRPGGHFVLADFAPPRGLGWLTGHEGAQTAAARERILTAAGLRIERQQCVVYPMILATVAAR
jgi:ubiquinone/menaquinone biosynthesis C-methylase UbiE